MAKTEKEAFKFELSEHDIEHRKSFATFAEQHSETWHRDHLARFYDKWHRWNDEFFGGKMVCPYLMIGGITGRRTMGHYQMISNFGGKSVIKLNRRILDGNFCQEITTGTKDPEGLIRISEDTLLHEMIHQYNTEILLRPEHAQRGHGVAFRNECNRIAEALGWEQKVRITKKTPKNSHLPSCAHWPEGVRPNANEYYLGAWVTLGGAREDENDGELDNEIIEEPEVAADSDAGSDASGSQGTGEGPGVASAGVSLGEWGVLLREGSKLTKAARLVLLRIAKLNGVIP